MLDDFGKSGPGGHGRFGASLGAAVLVFGAISGAVVAASAMVRHVVVEDDLVQVELALPPAPEPPPPPPPPVVEVATPPPATAAPARLGRARPRLQQPEVIPETRRPERDVPLWPPDDPFAPEQEGDPRGTPDGVIGGAPAGTGTAIVAEPTPAPAPAPRPRGPQRVIEGSTPPQVDREEIARHFEVPSEVRTAGIARITVVVRVTVAEDGRVMRVEVLRGHPLIPNDNVVRAVERSRFTPARLADGSAYSAIHTLPITIAVTL